VTDLGFLASGDEDFFVSARFFGSFGDSGFVFLSFSVLAFAAAACCCFKTCGKMGL
jgi:hypothetical protein